MIRTGYTIYFDIKYEAIFIKSRIAEKTAEDALTLIIHWWSCLSHSFTFVVNFLLSSLIIAGLLKL